MALDQLLISAVPWLGWTGLGLSLLTVVAFLTRWGLRFRLVGISSFTFLLAVSCWAFGISYTPPVVVEGAIRAPVVFDNGEDLIVAQASADFPSEAIEPTLLRPSWTPAATQPSPSPSPHSAQVNQQIQNIHQQVLRSE